MAATTASKISQLYVSLFGRAPDSAGLAFWSEALDSGAWTFSSIAKSMFDTTPARAYYPTNATADAVVTTFYTNVLGRAPDAEGLAFWVKEYNAAVAAKDVGGFFAKLITNVVEYTGTDAAGLKSQSLFANKVTVAEFYGTNGGTIAGATAALTGVTEVASTVDTAKTAILNPVVAGQTFTLTTGADTLVGTAGNDTFTAVDSSVTTADTYSSSDTVLDTSSKDNDTMTITANGAVTATPVISGIENVNFNVNALGAAAVDVAGIKGATNITVTRGNVTVGDSVLTGNKAVELSHVNATKVTAGAGTTTVTVDQSNATATSSVAGVIVDADSATSTFSITGAATVNAAATTGVVTVRAINGAAAAENAKAVVINAAKSVEVAVSTNTSLLTGAVTINAAAAKKITVDNGTGGVTINSTTGAETVTDAAGITVSNIDDSGATITTGSYAKTTPGLITLEGTSDLTDVATVSGAGYISLDLDGTASDIVETVSLSGNGAAVQYTVSGGFTKLTGTSDVTVKTTATLASAKTISGAATLIIDTKAGAATDLSKVSVTTIDVQADLAGDKVTLATGANLLLSVDQTTELELNAKTSKATATFTLVDDTADSSASTIAIGNLLADQTYDFATLTINANDAALSASSVDISTNTDLIVTGSKAVTLGTLTTAKSVDASAVTGVVTATTSANATTLTTGTGNDVLTVTGAAAFTVSAGDGNNDVTIASSAADTTVVVTGSGDDVIAVNNDNAVVVSSGSGDDTVNVTAQAGAVGGLFVGGAGADVLAFKADNDSKSSTTFGFSGFETVFLDGNAIDLTISATQFGGQKFAVKGTAADDTFTVTGASTTKATTIDASNVTVSGTATLTYIGSDLADTLTGGKADETFRPDQGADTIVGGAGTDTVSYEDITTGTDKDSTTYGAGTISGVVVNLGDSAITTSSVLSVTGLNLSGGLTSVASGSAAYLFAAADKTANSANVDTISGVENITGTAGSDYLVGSTGANTITAGDGADFIKGGVGADTIVLSADTVVDTVIYAAGDSTTTVTVASTVASASATFDKISAFELAGVDKLDLAGTATVAADQAVEINGTDSTGYVLLAAIKGHKIADGMITFDDQETNASFSALSLTTAAKVAAAIEYLSLNDLGDAGVSVAFVGNSNTYVYQQTATTAGSVGGFTLIELTGITALALMTSGTTADGVLIG